MSNGLRALLVVASSTLLGAIYFPYLNAAPFPPDVARLVPAVWLAGALVGGMLAARGLRTDRSRVVASFALLLGIPSAILAFLFTIAALMGD